MEKIIALFERLSKSDFGSLQHTREGGRIRRRFAEDDERGRGKV